MVFHPCRGRVGRHWRDQKHMRLLGYLGDDRCLVTTQNELMLDPIQKLFRRAVLSHPLLEGAIPKVLGTLGDEDDDSTGAHGMRGIVQSLLCLVEVRVPEWSPALATTMSASLRLSTLPH